MFLSLVAFGRLFFLLLFGRVAVSLTHFIFQSQFYKSSSVLTSSFPVVFSLGRHAILYIRASSNIIVAQTKEGYKAGFPDTETFFSRNHLFNLKEDISVETKNHELLNKNRTSSSD